MPLILSPFAVPFLSQFEYLDWECETETLFPITCNMKVRVC